MDTKPSYINLDRPAGFKCGDLLSKLLAGEDLSQYFSDMTFSLDGSGEDLARFDASSGEEVDEALRNFKN